MTQDRLIPSYYEPLRTPPEVIGWASEPDTLGPGSAAKVGILELGFEVLGGRTELVERFQKAPLHIVKPLWYDPNLPEMAFLILMSSGGGIAQADRYRTDVRCGPDTLVHLTTQAATKVYRMEHDYATQLVNIDAGPGAYVEYLPDPLIPFKDARYYQRTEVTVAPGGTVVLGDTLTAGRLARNERHQYRVLATDLRIGRPDGRLLAVDTLRLQPDDPGSGSEGVLGPGVLAGYDHVASLFVVTDRRPADEVADTLHRALVGTGLPYGVSVLPHDCGAWLRLVGDSPVEVARAQRTAWDAVRRLLIGQPAPDLRKP